MSNENQNLQENEIEDEMENDFLELDENIINKLVPKDELKNFEIDINEIMKSGCNRQIAEYALMKYNIQEKLKKENQDYIESKTEIKNDIINKLGPKLSDLLKDENRRDEDVEYDPFFEEVIDEIVKDLLTKKTKNIIDVNLIKKGVVQLISNENYNFDKFKNDKEKYIKIREPIIEAALRLVKKIVNKKKSEDSEEFEDSDEYKEFVKEYYGNEKIEAFIWILFIKIKKNIIIFKYTIINS